jgi:hypothetical protein
MDDDSFANIVRSNKPHSVSVSERTGNATTAKNIVSSDADDQLPKKTAFEKEQQEVKINGAKSGDKENNIQFINIENENPNSTEVFQDLFNPKSNLNLNRDIPTNLQKLVDDNPGNNTQSISTTKSSINKQGIGDPKFTKNIQPITHQSPSLNIQGIPEDDQVGINRQQIDSGDFKDPFEILPSEKVIRDKVDIGSANKNRSTSTQQTASSKSLKEHSAVSTTIDSSSNHLELTTQEAAKLKRDKLNEDFQGRVAAIRRNVKTLNGKLDSFDAHA